MQYKKVKDFQNQKKAEKNVEIGRYAIIDFKSCTLESYDDIYKKYKDQKKLKVIFECFSEKFRFFSKIDNSFELKAQLVSYKNLIYSSNELINNFNTIGSNLILIGNSLKKIILFIAKNNISSIKTNFEQEFTSLSKDVLDIFLNFNYDNKLILISRKRNQHKPCECRSETKKEIIKKFKSNIENLIKQDIRKKEVIDFYNTLFNTSEFEELFQKNIYFLQTGLYINQHTKIEFLNLNFIILELFFLFAETYIKNNKGWSFNQKIIGLLKENIDRIKEKVEVESSKYLEKIKEINIYKKNFEKNIQNLDVIFNRQKDTIINGLNHFMEQENEIYEFYQFTNN